MQSSAASYHIQASQGCNELGWMQSEMHFSAYFKVGHYSRDTLSSLALFLRHVTLITGVNKEELCGKVVENMPDFSDLKLKHCLLITYFSDFSDFYKTVSYMKA